MDTNSFETFLCNVLRTMQKEKALSVVFNVFSITDIIDYIPNDAIINCIGLEKTLEICKRIEKTKDDLFF